MMWDFRGWIRRGGGSWPRRPWMTDRPIRPPSDLPKSPPPADEKWLADSWRPEKTADDWKKSDPPESGS